MRETLTFPLIPRHRVAGGDFGNVRGVRRGRGTEHVASNFYDPNRDSEKDMDWAAVERSGNDELFTRVFNKNEAIPVVILADRIPSMQNPSDDAPRGMLRKHSILIEAGSQITDTAIRSGVIGYRDFSHGTLFHKVANGKTESWKVREKYLHHRHFSAEAGMLAEHLRDFRSLPGAFVFVFSDYTDETLLDSDTWSTLSARGYDVVPIIVQDPRWEQTFPQEASGLVLPFVDAETGAISHRRYSKKEVERQMRDNKARLIRIRDTFMNARLEHIELDSEDPHEINRKFHEWANARQRGVRR